MEAEKQFCPSCGKENLLGSVFCSSCGKPFPESQPPGQPHNPADPVGRLDYQRSNRQVSKKRGRKRLLILGMVALAIVVIVAVAATAGGDDKTAGGVSTTVAGGSANSATKTAATDPLDSAWGTAVKLKDLTVTLSAPVDDTANLGENDFMLSEGNKAIYCMATIVNTGDESYTYNTLSFTMFDSEGMTYDSLFPITSKPDLGSGDLLPGKTVKGAVAFEMPKAAVPAYVNFQRDIISDTEASWGE